MAELIDRETVLGVIGGGVLGAKGFSFGTALGLTIVITAATVAASHIRPDLCPATERSNATRFALDTVLTMGAWWAGRELFPHPARRLEAGGKAR